MPIDQESAASPYLEITPEFYMSKYGIRREPILGHVKLRGDFVHVQDEFCAHPSGGKRGKDEKVRQRVYVNNHIPVPPHHQRQAEERPHKERCVLESIAD